MHACVCSLLDLRYAKHLGLSNQLFGQLADLPGTAGMDELKQRAEALSGWRVRTWSALPCQVSSKLSADSS